MQITPINNTANFKGLDTCQVITPKATKLVAKELPKLKELGKNYNITLYSEYDFWGKTEYLTAFVNHLGEKPGIWRILFGNKGKKTVTADCCDSVTELVDNAIASLNKK